MITTTGNTVYDPQYVQEISRRPGALNRTLQSGDRIRARAEFRREVTELLRENAVPHYITQCTGRAGDVIFEISERDIHEFRIPVSINSY